MLWSSISCSLMLGSYYNVTGVFMQIKRNYVLGLTLAISLMACGKEEKTKTVTVENPATVEALKAAEKERDELNEKLKLAGNIDELKANLDTANARVAELDKSIKDKEDEIAAAKKELEEAKKSGDAKTAEWEAKVKELETQKSNLTKDLETATADKTRLAAQVETAKRDEGLFKNIIDYAVARGAKDREAIGAALDKDLQAIAKRLEDLAAKEAGLKSAITNQAQVVVKAAENLERVSKNMKGVYEELSTRASGGQALSNAEKSTLETLKTYFQAAQDEGAEKKNKEGLEKAVADLNKEISGLNATLATAEGELAKFNEELLTLALTDIKLESPRAKELTKLIGDRKSKIAQTNETKVAKTKALVEQNDRLTASKDKIKVLVKTQQDKLTAYQDSDVLAARDALNRAEKELEARVGSYNSFQKDTADAQARKAELTTFKNFYMSKLKPDQG